MSKEQAENCLRPWWTFLPFLLCYHAHPHLRASLTNNAQVSECQAWSKGPLADVMLVWCSICSNLTIRVQNRMPILLIAFQLLKIRPSVYNIPLWIPFKRFYFCHISSFFHIWHSKILIAENMDITEQKTGVVRELLIHPKTRGE